MSPRSLENLKGQILYFGSPLQFNDPYDCALVPNVLLPSDEEVEEIRLKFLTDPDITPIQIATINAAHTDGLRQILLGIGHTVLKNTVKSFLQERGVTCFSENNDNLLMWSHYGGRYAGFCLEFSTAFTPFDKIRKVKYRTDLPKIDLKTLHVSDNYDQVLEFYCTKSEAWSYESEWRAVHAKAGTKFGYQSECLTGVYFGPDISSESLEIICLILGGQNETVKLWRGKRSTTEFKVEFEPFTYTSHLEAKRKGLL